MPRGQSAKTGFAFACGGDWAIGEILSTFGFKSQNKPGVRHAPHRQPRLMLVVLYRCRRLFWGMWTNERRARPVVESVHELTSVF